MSKYDTEFVTDLPLDKCIKLFEIMQKSQESTQGQQSSKWEVANIDGSHITLKERKNLVGMMLSNSYPVQIDLTLEENEEGTWFLIDASNFGIGPFQSNAVKNRVNEFIEEIQELIEAVKQIQIEVQIENEIELEKNIRAGIICPNCYEEIPDGAKFCPHCSHPITRKCENCGKQNMPSAKFCIECGNALM